MTKQHSLSILIALFLPLLISAQHLEFGLMGGTSHYLGDLVPKANRFSTGKTHFMGGAFLKYNINNFVAIRAGGNYGKLSADDADSNIESRKLRNLSFESKLIEGNLIAEFNILGYQPYNLARPFSPYIFAGVAFFNFKPQAELNGSLVDLQPLGTEGQGLAEFPERKFYQLTQFSIPVGAGIKYALNDQINLGFEIGIRKTFTDYIDDVSLTYVDDVLLTENRGPETAALANRTGAPIVAGAARGSAENDDWYIISGITLSYNFIDNGLVGSRKRGKRRKDGCPTF